MWDIFCHRTKTRFSDDEDDNELTADQSILLRPPGTQFFVRRLVNALPEGIIQYNKRVKRIDYGNAGHRHLFLLELGQKYLHAAESDEVKITLRDGETIQCDHVIVTVSAGVLKEEGGSMFNPPIHSIDPRKQQAISDVGKA